MSEKSVTDSGYSMIERLEARRMRMRAVPTICFILSSFALALGAWSYLVFSHQKGSLLDQYLLLSATGILLGGVFILVGSKKYSRIKKYESSLAELEDLERTVYKEVFGSE